MSRKKINIITAIAATLMIIGVVMAYMKIETLIWFSFIVVPMVLIRYMLYKLKKEKHNNNGEVAYGIQSI